MNRDRTTWLVVLFLLVGVLTPATIVVWFVDQSVERETAAAHQTLTAAYREQLRLIRGHIDAFWSDRARLLAQDARLGGAAAFQRIVASGLADSAIVLNDRSVPAYPAAFAETENEEGSDRQTSIAARAAQAEIRALIKTKDTASALAAIQKYFVNGPAKYGLDADGRLIAADEL